MNDPWNIIVFVVTVAAIVLMIDVVITWWKDK